MESHYIDPRALEGTADCEQPSASQVSPQASLEQTATDSLPFGSPGSSGEYEMPPSPATIYAAIRQRQTASAERGQEGVDPHNQGPSRLNDTAYLGYDWYMPIPQDKPPQPLYYPLDTIGLPPLKRCAAEQHRRSAPEAQEESASDDHSASSPFLGDHPEIFSQDSLETIARPRLYGSSSDQSQYGITGLFNFLKTATPGIYELLQVVEYFLDHEIPVRGEDC
ncbi:unnamed protein product [Aspergillus oryzae]|nr:unnamed protein product [Aspergillus oryzae]